LADTRCTHGTGINKNTVGLGHRGVEFVDNEILDWTKFEGSDKLEYQRLVSEEGHAPRV